MIKIVCDICGQPCNQYNSSKVKYYIMREELAKKPEKSAPLDLCGKCANKFYTIVNAMKPTF